MFFVAVQRNFFIFKLWIPWSRIWCWAYATSNIWNKAWNKTSISPRWYISFFYVRGVDFLEISHFWPNYLFQCKIIKREKKLIFGTNFLQLIDDLIIHFQVFVHYIYTHEFSSSSLGVIVWNRTISSHYLITISFSNNHT